MEHILFYLLSKQLWNGTKVKWNVNPQRWGVQERKQQQIRDVNKILETDKTNGWVVTDEADQRKLKSKFQGEEANKKQANCATKLWNISGIWCIIYLWKEEWAGSSGYDQIGKFLEILFKKQLTFEIFTPQPGNCASPSQQKTREWLSEERGFERICTQRTAVAGGGSGEEHTENRVLWHTP